MINNEAKIKLEQLGQRLKTARLARNESQYELATRLGVSIPTLHKMEQGSSRVSIGLWIQALWLFDRIDELDLIFKPQQSLFDQYEAEQTSIKRKRAKKRKKS